MDNTNLQLEVLQELIEAMRQQDGDSLQSHQDGQIPGEVAPSPTTDEAHREMHPEQSELPGGDIPNGDSDEMSPEDAQIIEQLFGHESPDQASSEPTPETDDESKEY